MVKNLKIGVIGIQGAVSEHINILNKLFFQESISGKAFSIKNNKQINEIDALILPGGESTTISRILFQKGFDRLITKRAKEENIPVMGTCAGCVVLSSEINDYSHDVKLLNAMNMKVTRNAFGRQRESFEYNLEIDGFLKPYNAVFIRAPIIEKVWGKCKAIAKINEKIVMAREGNFLALSFHPELTDDLRIHQYFLDMI